MSEAASDSISSTAPQELKFDDARPLEDAPYPFLIMENFLDQAFCDQLVSEFPDETEVLEWQSVMGGRRRLGSEQKRFYRFLDEKPAWKRLYGLLNSEQFVAAIFDRFGAELKELANQPDRPWVFDPDLLRRRASDYAGYSLLDRFKLKLGMKLDNDPVPAPADKDRIYLHFDISYATDGYKREIHRDSDPRIAAFLIYFSDAAETGGSGGEFGVHRLPAGSGKPFVAKPDDGTTETVAMLRAQKNLFVLFLSQPNSYHSVPEIMGANGARKFIYVGVSSERRYWREGGVA